MAKRKKDERTVDFLSTKVESEPDRDKVVKVTGACRQGKIHTFIFMSFDDEGRKVLVCKNCHGTITAVSNEKRFK